MARSLRALRMSAIARWGREVSLGEEKIHAELVGECKLRELAAWGKFDVYTQCNARHVSKKVARTRWVFPGRWLMGDMC